MLTKRWFGAKVATESSGFVRHAIDRLLPHKPTADMFSRPGVERPAIADSSFDASWTASLKRGDDLPPCRLSVLIASGSRSAMRLEPYRSESRTASRANKR
jgi:hypothetical protein